MFFDALFTRFLRFSVKDISKNSKQIVEQYHASKIITYKYSVMLCSLPTSTMRKYVKNNVRCKKFCFVLIVRPLRRYCTNKWKHQISPVILRTPGEWSDIGHWKTVYKRYVRLGGKKTNYAGEKRFYQPNGNVPSEPRGITFVAPYGVLCALYDT